MGALKSKFRRSKSSKRDGEKSNATNKKKKQQPANLPESQSARKVVDPRLPFSNYRQIFSIRNAWKAISRSMEECAKETLIRLLRSKPHHRKQFSHIKNISDEDEMRHNDDFETAAMDIYQIFDDVVSELENVDKALKGIQFGAPNSRLTQRMVKDMESPFIETIRIYLGSDRFTETTEGNFKLLYQFIQEEMGKYLEEGEVEVAADVNTTVSEPAGTGGPSANIGSPEVGASTDNTEVGGPENSCSSGKGDEKSDRVEDNSAVVSDAQVEVNICPEATS